MAILSTIPAPTEKDDFPFCSEIYIYTHAHTLHICVYMAVSLRTCSPTKPPFHSFPLLHSPRISIMYSYTSISNRCHGVFSPPPPF